MREQPGFRGVLILADPETDEGYNIVLWETEADVMASESSGVFQEQVANLGLARRATRQEGLLSQHPDVGTFVEPV